VPDDGGGGGEGHGRDENGVSGAHSNGFERQVQGGGAGVDRDRVGRAHECGEPAFEILDSLSGGEPSGIENRGNRRLLFFSDAGTEIRDVHLFVLR
jgi:hypothetical protein